MGLGVGICAQQRQGRARGDLGRHPQEAQRVRPHPQVRRHRPGQQHASCRARRQRLHPQASSGPADHRDRVRLLHGLRASGSASGTSAASGRPAQERHRQPPLPADLRRRLLLRRLRLGLDALWKMQHRADPRGRTRPRAAADPKSPVSDTSRSTSPSKRDPTSSCRGFSHCAALKSTSSSETPEHHRLDHQPSPPSRSRTPSWRVQPPGIASKFIPKKLVTTVSGSAITLMIVSVFMIWFRLFRCSTGRCPAPPAPGRGTARPSPPSGSGGPARRGSTAPRLHRG